MAPQGDLQKAGFHPSVVHPIDLLGRMSTLRQKRAKGERHRKAQQKQIAKRHDLLRGRAVGGAPRQGCGFAPTKPYQTSRIASTWSFSTSCDRRRYLTSS